MPSKSVTYKGIISASNQLAKVLERTPLQLNPFLSEEYGAKIYLKREDLQNVRSYKIRGAYNFISRLTASQIEKGVVCASAGNHAQGFALSCQLLSVSGIVFMPTTTPKQKVRQVQRIGQKFVEVILEGDTYDDAKLLAAKYVKKNKRILVPPFDHKLIIEGQGTVALEILNQIEEKKVDYVFMPIGGGGLASGMSTVFKFLSPDTQLIGAEPKGAPAMHDSIRAKKLVELEAIDNFVDGAAVKKVGALTLEICRKNLDDLVLVPEGRICTRILQLYNRSAIVAEPAGALCVAALDQFKKQIKNKTVVCVLSGGNNDIERMPDIKERSLIHEGLKHYFIIKFPQRSGALKEFVNDVLGPSDNITLFEYTKKNSKESGPALVGIEFVKKEDYKPLIKRMESYGINYTLLNENQMMYNLLI